MAERGASGGVPIPERGHPRYPWFCPKPTLNILFYTDDDRVSFDANVHSPAHDFGVRILRDLLLADDSDQATLQVTLLNRHQPSHAATKLTPTLLANYDEVWFFGTIQANTTSQPENELVDAEVAALSDWMATGGVLMAGDHSNPRPQGADPSLNDLLSLGRAIGHRVPRAGELRRWDGGPPISGPDSYNTQVPTPEVPIGDIENLAAQEDEWPQQLILKTYAAGGGPLDAAVAYGRRVHRLFCGRTAPITVFPDHMHEGHLTIPSTLPAATWPSGSDGQPEPEVIARGTDKRTGEIYDLVIAYDGDQADIGRIVADSTWHHYFNVNLRGFPTGGGVITRLAQYYVNLALWLAPPAKRSQIACWLRWKLVHYPTVDMAYPNSRADIGRVAAGILRRNSGPCVIRDIFYPVVRLEKLVATRPSDEDLLGGVLHEYFQAFERADAGEEVGAEEDMNALVASGIRAANDEFLANLEARLTDAREARQDLEEQLRTVDAGDR
jgi:hypothetical protein